ncbi:hypothetical protein KF840_19820 [bacterium]|nr:hypothetical protein [bacterium]
MLFGRSCLAIAAAIAAAGAAFAGVALPTPTGTPYVPPTPPGLFTVAGHVAAGPGCAGDLAGATVSISPAVAPAARTGTDGRFAFADLTYGHYILSVAPNCPLIPCYPDRDVFVDASGDVALDLCRDDCPADLRLSIRQGAPGALVDASGRCDAARGNAVTIWFDDQPLAEATADASGVYRATVTVPLDAPPDAGHLLRATLGEREIASAEFMTAYGPAPCVGDCNRDGVVTIDELLRGIRIALGLADASLCWSIDASLDGSVSIEELIAAVQRALTGCRLPDLAPLEIAFSRCLRPTCYDMAQETRFMQVCVANQGASDSPGFVVVEQTGGGTGFAPPLPAGTQECIEMPLVPAPEIAVDPGNDVVEEDESNNTLATVLAVPTSCEATPLPCTPTPPPTLTQTPTPT